ncbi:hypothetical protein TNCT_678921 [Trichonephila clavata]|uniref:Uncharacterized protein n=1 Tax=Trichonephila clavata TaxID=2740835 RepID=A0A8X6LDC2_TRICU|nr:hypothetical protein TNCT_678921 [Trichonephila clavata]
MLEEIRHCPSGVMCWKCPAQIAKPQAKQLDVAYFLSVRWTRDFHSLNMTSYYAWCGIDIGKQMTFRGKQPHTYTSIIYP